MSRLDDHTHTNTHTQTGGHKGERVERTEQGVSGQTGSLSTVRVYMVAAAVFL